MSKYTILLILLCLAPTLACGSQTAHQTATAARANSNATSTSLAIASATEWQGVLLTATVVTWTPSPTNTATLTPTKTFTPTLTFTPSQTFTPSATFTPSDTSTPRPLNSSNLKTYDMAQGGVEVFPMPDRSSGRLFAAVSNFSPYVAGKNQDSTWLYIYFFDGDLQEGWVSRNRLAISDNEVNRLPTIDPDDTPQLPSLRYNEDAARPYGASVRATQAPTAVIQAPALQNPVNQDPVTQPNNVAPTQAPIAPPPVEQPSFSCGTCSQMSSCDQAYACLGANPGLDGDGDGVPCESICR